MHLKKCLTFGVHIIFHYFTSLILLFGYIECFSMKSAMTVGSSSP